MTADYGGFSDQIAILGVFICNSMPYTCFRRYIFTKLLLIICQVIEYNYRTPSNKKFVVKRRLDKENAQKCPKTLHVILQDPRCPKDAQVIIETHNNAPKSP